VSNKNTTTWWDNHREFLWQAMGKENLDVNDKLTHEEWMLFVEQFSDVFAENASSLANDCWMTFLGANPEIDAKVSDFDD
jgi:hypothetical protein